MLVALPKEQEQHSCVLELPGLIAAAVVTLAAPRCRGWAVPIQKCPPLEPLDEGRIWSKLRRVGPSGLSTFTRREPSEPLMTPGHHRLPCPKVAHPHWVSGLESGRLRMTPR
ncbi:hypothetical protein MRX96_020654 [Rhipicephalus microplus]